MLRELVLAIGIPLLVLLLAVLALEQWRDQLPPWLQQLAERPSWLWNAGIGLIIGLSLLRWLLQHQDCDAALPQVLLVAEVGVGGDQQFIALPLSQANQVPIGDGGPAQFVGRGHKVAVQRAAQRNRCSLVKQDPHSGHGCSRTPGGMLQHRAGLLLRHSREKLDEFSQGDAVFQVLEQSSHRDSCAAEHPDSTDALGISLHRRAATPAEFALRAHGPILADF
jgi:hypothetical protein